MLSHPKVWVMSLHTVLKVATLPKKQPAAGEGKMTHHLTDSTYHLQSASRHTDL